MSLHFLLLSGTGLKAISEEVWSQLTAEAQEIYRTKLVPKFSQLANFVGGEYLSKCREQVGIDALPGGGAWYRSEVARRTSTSLDPETIHTLGLGEVKRIRSQMEQLLETLKKNGTFQGNTADFHLFLRTDPRFYFNDPEELLREYRNIAKKIDSELPRLFGTLPRLPYGVKAVPGFMAKEQTTAYYSPGSPREGVSGTFFANTYNLMSRPKWEMEALTLHEAVPGHHLQTALAQELDDLPEFRKSASIYDYCTAFVEGWGLYSESLGSEMGLYQEPHSHYGQLTYEMWRAVRLVVDTGMHAKGWTRDQAIAFFTANSSKPLHDIEVEIDRYIVWPGQALAYKIGELKFKELKTKAKTALADRFDIRKFHDVVLEAGPLPLSILENRVDAWIERAKRGISK